MKPPLIICPVTLNDDNTVMRDVSLMLLTVVEFLGVLRRTDAGIFLCVPSPDHEDGIFVERLNTGTLGKVQSAKLDTETSEGGNMPWVKVIGRGSKKVTQQDLSIAEQVERMPGTDRKARRNTSKRGQR